MWKTVLDEEEMERMSFGCTRRDGDLMSWRNMRSALLGDASVNYDVNSCQDGTGFLLFFGVDFIHHCSVPYARPEFQSTLRTFVSFIT